MNQLLLFDYAALDSETRIVVQQRTAEIHSLMKRTTSDIIEIGQKLTEIKDRLGRGSFGDWLKHEFDWSHDTANRFMAVSRKFENTQIAEFAIAPSALYLLAGANVPDEVVESVLDRAAEGETITHAAVKQALANEPKPPANLVNLPTYAKGDRVWVGESTNQGTFIRRLNLTSGLVKFDHGKMFPVELQLIHAVTIDDIPEPEPESDPLPSIGDFEPYDQPKPCLYFQGEQAIEAVALGSRGALFVRVQWVEQGEVEESDVPLGVIGFLPTEPEPQPTVEDDQPEQPFIAARSGNDEHYTPEEIWRPGLGNLERYCLDPASNSHENPNVPAKKVYTLEDDGLVQPWEGMRIWLNPPYSKMEPFVLKLFEALDEHDIDEALCLVKCDCRTYWFRRLVFFSTAFLMIHKAVKFLGNDNSSFFGSVLFYFGDSPEWFHRQYQHLGSVCCLYDPNQIEVHEPTNR